MSRMLVAMHILVNSLQSQQQMMSQTELSEKCGEFSYGIIENRIFTNKYIKFLSETNLKTNMWAHRLK